MATTIFSVLEGTDKQPLLLLMLENLLNLYISKFAQLSMEKSAAQVHDWELNEAKNLYSVSSECTFWESV